MFCCILLYVHSSIAIILMGKRDLVALLNLFSWCLGMVELLFLAVPWGCLRFVIVVFPDHTHLLFLPLSYFVVKTQNVFSSCGGFHSVCNISSHQIIVFKVTDNYIYLFNSSSSRLIK